MAPLCGQWVITYGAGRVAEHLLADRAEHQAGEAT